MRKSKLFTAGVLALTLALGLVLAGCGDTDDGGTTFTVSYDVGAGSGTPPSNQTVNSGQSINLPGQGNMTPPSGDSFNGWRTGGVNYSAGDSYTVTGNVTFTAQWGSSGGGGGTAVTLNSVSANGSSSQTTTELTLTFSAAITGLSAGDITLTGVSGVSGGTLSGSNPYTLTISGFTSGGTLSVAVAKSGYTISGSPKTAAIYYSGSSGGGDTPVTFSSVSANGSSSQTTTSLTLTFSQAINGLSASDINLSGVSGVSGGTLSGSNPYTLTISGFTSGGTLSVAVAKSGYTISGSPKSTTIYYSSGGGTTKPNAPTGVTATAQSPYSIRISWNAVSGATSYKVYWGVASYSTFTQLAGTSTTTYYVDDECDAGETFYYKVSAVNGAGEGALSSYVYATTLSILGKWYTTQSAANSGTGTPAYEFLASGSFYVSGLSAGTFTDNYSASGATGNTVVIKSGGTTLGTATFSLSGTTMTITNAGSSGLSTGTYYKKAN